MEIVSTNITRATLVQVCLLSILLLFCNKQLCAQQPINHIIVKDGKMIIELSKNISTASLENFITKHNLQNLGLKGFIEKHATDSLHKQGWKEIDKGNK